MSEDVSEDLSEDQIDGGMQRPQTYQVVTSTYQGWELPQEQLH